MKVSIIIPTRARYEMFVRCINSFFENCASVDNFEVLAGVDNDDIDTVAKIQNYILDKPNIKLFFYERQTYLKLHTYWNDLSKKASADSKYLLFWTDDGIITSKNWDLEILKYHADFLVLSPKVSNMETYWKTQGLLFPIVAKEWADVIGEITPSPGIDSWMDVLGKRLGALVNIESIVVYHDRYDLTGHNNDQLFHECRSIINTPEFHTTDNPSHSSGQVILEQHYQKLLPYLDAKYPNRTKYPWPN